MLLGETFSQIWNLSWTSVLFLLIIIFLLPIFFSLFPKEVHSRLFDDVVPTTNRAPKYKLQSFQREQEKETEKVDSGKAHSTPPIADLFPECTVMFCDIAVRLVSVCLPLSVIVAVTGPTYS